MGSAAISASQICQPEFENFGKQSPIQWETLLIKLNATGNLSDEAIQLGVDEIGKWTFAPRSDWTEMGDTDHFVQFYEADGFLLNSLSGFIGQAITSGDGALVLATREHREGLDELMRATGLDVSYARACGRYV